MDKISDGPLGHAFVGLPGFSYPSLSYETNVANWEVLLLACIEDKQAKKLTDHLSPSQKTALNILLEWWHDEDLPHGRMLKDWIKSPSRIVPKLPGAYYEKHCFELWLWEIGTCEPPELAKPDLGINIQWKRQTTAAAAAAYRLSRAALSGTVIDRAESCMVPNTFGDVIPACIHACPWIRQDQMKGYPHYVWGIKERCTMKFPPTCPEYLVISHTWGRWAIKNEYCDIPGVPWKVPQNEIYKVDTIPDKLSSLPFGIDYVWLDLVCIPQDGSDLQREEIARQTTIFASAKWVTIWFSGISELKGLSAAVNWLAMMYLREFESETNITHDMATMIESNAKSPSSMARPPRNNVVTSDTLLLPGQALLEPDGWFTSLWTLQEACLRPDMFICDKDWQLFRVGTGSKMAPVTLDHVIALFGLAWERVGPKAPDGVPLSVKELAGVLGRTTMHKLLELSATDILTLGNQRYCQDTNRAKAIMSALGVTDWYKQNAAVYDSPSAKLRTTFILQKYPVEFVEEVKRKFGSMIFAVTDFGSVESNQYHYDWRGRLKATNLTATLLPFSNRPLQQRYLLFSSLGTEDEPCVRDWVINQDGSVTISKASIVASCPSKSKDSFKIAIVAAPGGKYVRGEYFLTEWLSSFRKSSEKHAIGLVRRAFVLYHGVILERVYNSISSNRPKRPKRFMKIGTFDFTADGAAGTVSMFQFPAPQHVDWVVL